MQASARDQIKRWLRPELRALSAYRVADATGLIKLDAMENPYALPRDLRQTWAARLAEIDINRYPDPRAAALKAGLREWLGLDADRDMLIGNGSDELIQLLCMAMAGHTFLAPEPSFSMYPHCSRMAGMHYRGMPLDAGDFGLPLEPMLEAIAEARPALVFIANPNNPTGNLFASEALRRIIEASPGLVVVDEAYYAFSGSSLIELLGAYPQLMIMRTLSKMGLAGLRLGVLAGHPDWIAELDKLRLPYNVNSLSQLSGRFFLEHRAVFDAQVEDICAQRGVLSTALAGLPRVEVLPSRTNFVLFRVPDAGQVYRDLEAGGVLVKCLHGSAPALENCLRVTVGNAAENRCFIERLTAIVGAGR